jgi:hypothetical protein
MTAAEKNCHYAALNDRFDIRAAQLRAVKFKYTHIPEYDTAMFVRQRLGRKVPTTIPAAFVMHADDQCWADRLAELSS